MRRLPQPPVGHLSPEGTMERYRVGDLVVDADGAAVSRAGRPISLPPLTFNLLLALVRRAPDTVRREELLGTVWPGEFVSDETLSQRVRLLRRALGDDTAAPRYIASVRGWGYRLAARIEAVVTSEEPIRALAVLPLANLAADPGQEYLSDGLTDALITSLSKFRALKVISRTSAMRYRNTDKPLPQVGRELAVQAIVEGSVLRAGPRVWATVQLVRAATDEHVWAQSYEREVGDIPSLLNEVAETIAEAIHLAVSPEESRRVERRRRIDPDVYDAGLRAAYQVMKYTPADVARGMAELEALVAREPGFAEAHAVLAGACIMAAVPFGVSMPAAEQHRLLARSRAAAEAALQVDDTLASAQAVLGVVLFFEEWDWRQAEEVLERAIRLEPSCSSAHHSRSVVAACLGDRETTVREGERTIELDPFNLLQRIQLAESYYWVRDYDRAIREARETLGFDAAYPRAHFVLARICEARGRIPEAIEHHRLASMITEDAADAALRAFRKDGPAGFHRWALNVGFGGQGCRPPQAGAPRRFRAWLEAKLHCQAGRLEEALDYLEQAYAERDGLLVLLNVDVWDPLRGHPRFQDLVRRVGIPSRQVAPA